MRLSSKLFAALLAVPVCLLATSSQAGTILQPTGVTTNMGNGNAGDISQIVDQSGLSMNYVSGVTDFDIYIAGNPTHNSASPGTTWDSNIGTTTGNVDFDLGGSFLIESFALWNRGGNAGDNVIGFSLFIDDNAAFSSATMLGSFNANPNTGFITAVGVEVFSFAATAGQFVRMQITSNNGAALDILGEVAFERQTSVANGVPEGGGTAFMMLGAFAALVVLQRPVTRQHGVGRAAQRRQQGDGTSEKLKR